MGETEPQWLRVRQVAAMTEISRWTVARRAASEWGIRTRVFPTGKGNETRYNAADVKAFVKRIENGEYTAGGAPAEEA